MKEQAGMKMNLISLWFQTQHLSVKVTSYITSLAIFLYFK
jgi:hypothetical protein